MDILNAEVPSEASQPKKTGFWDGVILLTLNPKAYVIIAAMFSQFAVMEDHLLMITWITTVFTLNNLIAFSAWTCAGD